MKEQTAIIELIQDIKNYVKSLDTPDNEVYKKNELLIMSCFGKSMELAENKLEKEKEQIDNKVIHFAEWLTKKHTLTLMTLYEQFEELHYNKEL